MEKKGYKGSKWETCSTKQCIKKSQSYSPSHSNPSCFVVCGSGQNAWIKGLQCSRVEIDQFGWSVVFPWACPWFGCSMPLLRGISPARHFRKWVEVFRLYEGRIKGLAKGCPQIGLFCWVLGTKTCLISFVVGSSEKRTKSSFEACTYHRGEVRVGGLMLT